MSNFSVLNESSLHKTLKLLYSTQYEGETEVELDGHVYDILTKDNEVIEIQTKNLCKLLPKVMDALQKEHKVRIVHPIIAVNTIELYQEDETFIYRRKSPRKENIYDIFRELTGIYPVLLNKNFTLEILEIEIIEKRVRTPEEVQSKNNRRRFKRNWNKVNKSLGQIIHTYKFKTKKDYLSLLPSSLPPEFTSKQLSSALMEQKLPARTYRNSNLILWVLSHMELIEMIGKERNAYVYKIK